MAKNGKEKAPPSGHRPTAIGTWVFEVRENGLQLTREEFAEKIGSSPGTVVKWESGERKNVRGDYLKKILAIAPPALRATCPVTTIVHLSDLHAAKDSADPGAYGKVSDPPGIVASIKSRLEGALDQRAEQFEGKQLLFIQREIELLAPRLAGSTLTDEALAAYVDGLARFARKFGGGNRS